MLIFYFLSIRRAGKFLSKMLPTFSSMKRQTNLALLPKHCFYALFGKHSLLAIWWWTWELSLTVCSSDSIKANAFPPYSMRIVSVPETLQLADLSISKELYYPFQQAAIYSPTWHVHPLPPFLWISQTIASAWSALSRTYDLGEVWKFDFLSVHPKSFSISRRQVCRDLFPWPYQWWSHNHLCSWLSNDIYWW